MSVNFSTIQPMSQATISKAPAYSKTAAQPAASSPINYQAPKQKKSRWFLKTLIAAAAVLGGAVLLRGKVSVFKDFDVAAKLADDAKFLDKLKHYGKKAVALLNLMSQLPPQTVRFHNGGRQGLITNFFWNGLYPVFQIRSLFPPVF